MVTLKYIVGTLKGVASFWGVTEPTVNEWRQQGMPGRRGRWDLSAIARWYRIRRTFRADGNGDATMAQAKLARAHAEARLAEIKVERSEGRLVGREAAAAELRRTVLFCRSILDALPSVLATRIAGRKLTEDQAMVVVETALAELVDKRLNEGDVSGGDAR